MNVFSFNYCRHYVTDSHDYVTCGHRCEAFAVRGCTVYATARNLEAMGDFTGDGIHKLTLDVTKENEINTAVATIIQAEGQIDILVNNAGIANKGTLSATTDNHYSLFHPEHRSDYRHPHGLVATDIRDQRLFHRPHVEGGHPPHGISQARHDYQCRLHPRPDVGSPHGGEPE